VTSRTEVAPVPELAGMPGLDPRWSRRVEADDADGVRRSWHVLDNGAEPVHGTMLCVHGNPTWSYLWRRFLAEAPAGWRVVAVDQLGMGWSERTAARTLAQRVDDLGSLTDALGITGPVVTVAHAWGGPVSLGWALAHRAQLRAVVLTNTAVHQPAGAAAPSLIRLARTPGLRQAICVASPAFVRTTSALSWPPLPTPVRDALAAPYATPARRQAVGDFVADIPLDPAHPSAAPLDRIAEGLGALADVPVLMLWGPRDPVFSDLYLRDLLGRLPHAQVHRYEGASHLVTEDAPRTAGDVWAWVTDLEGPTAGRDQPEATGGAPLWAALTARAGDQAPAVVELGRHHRSISFALLDRRVRDLAAGLAATGVRPGDRVALLVPPGADLTAAVYACWRAGAVIVVADAGLGLRAMGRALRGAGPDHVIGIGKALAAARAMRVPGRRIAAGPLDAATRRALGARHGLADLARLGRDHDLPAPPPDDAECAIVFTSGATGPAKGVVYRHRQVQAQLEVLRATYELTADDRLVAAFAPFALYGPALGLASAVPDMDVTAPGTLTASALADAVAAVRATVVFASPAALRNVVATADALTPEQRGALAGVRLLMSAGAPVPAALLQAVRELMPHAEPHTPYGMTEVLPVADISLSELEAAGRGEGVCVGRPVRGVTVAVSPLAADGTSEGDPVTTAVVTGEVCVRAAHVKDRYDRLWATERASARTPGWHRTGDVGHLDDLGRLWVEGRLVHVVTGPDGPVTPVGVEQRVEALAGVAAAACVGVGPAGTQQVVLVVVPSAEGPPAGLAPAGLAPTGLAPAGLAPAELAGAVRAAAAIPVAAVLVTPSLPVDIRHASKVDRAAVARWADRVLAGGRVGRP
jgi:olefin beta-lactone synthetase